MIRRLASPKVLGAALAVSLAANLFLAGMIAGRLTGEAAQGLQALRNLDALLEPLPAAKRALVRDELRAALPGVREHHQAMQAARAELAEELVKPAPDPATMDRHFAAVQARTTAMQAALQQAFKRAAMSLTQEERRAMIEGIKRRARPQTIPDL